MYQQQTKRSTYAHLQEELKMLPTEPRIFGKVRRLFRSTDPAYSNALQARCPGCLAVIVLSELSVRIVAEGVRIHCDACEWETVI